MDKTLIFFGLGAGGLAVIIYFFHGLFTQRKWVTDDAVAIWASGAGLAAAVQVCCIAIAHWDKPPIQGAGTQIFLGGCSLGLLAIVSAVKKFKG